MTTDKRLPFIICALFCGEKALQHKHHVKGALHTRQAIFLFVGIKPFGKSFKTGVLKPFITILNQLRKRGATPCKAYYTKHV